MANLKRPPRTAANDNYSEDDTEADEKPALPNLDRELVDVSARQLVYAQKNGMTRWVGNRLVRIWNGHKWTAPDAEFGEARQRISAKADTEHFDAQTPEAQVEMARWLDVERLRAALGVMVATILDMAASDSTLGQIGEYLGFGGQYATRMARKEVREAVAALNAALAEEDKAAA